MLKISIWYDKNTVHENVPDDLETKCINCGKTIGCALGNQPIEEFITGFVTNFVFQHVGLSCIIKLKKELKFYFYPHYPYWVLNYPWYNTIFFSQLYGSYFEDYVTTAIKDRYNLIFSIESRNIMNPTVNYYAGSCVGRPLPHESTVDSLVSLGLTLNFINS